MAKLKISKKIIHILFYVLTFLVFVMPILRLIEMSFALENGYGIGNYVKLLSEVRTLKAIGNTVVISIFSTIISVVLGTCFAFIVAYTNINKKKVIEALVLAPFVIPSYIITLSWSNLLAKKGLVNTLITSVGLPYINIYSITGIIIVLGICNTPIVYMITVNMLRKIPRDLEWASRASGYSIIETMKKVNLVCCMPAIISGAVLAFLASIDNFSVPAFLGISSSIPVLSTYIYEKAISFGPTSFNLAASLSVILSIIAILGIVFQSKFIKKSSNLESIKEDYSVRIELSTNHKKIVEYVSLIFLVLVNIVPLITMVVSSFMKSYGGFKLSNIITTNYDFIFTNKGVKKAIFNSISLALITCVICIVIAMAISYLKVRKNSKVVRFMESGAELTYAIPGIVLALAMIFHWTMIPNVYGTIKILVISYVTRYLILQIKGCTTAMISLDESLEEAAMVSGSSKVRMWSKIITPLLLKQVLSSSFLIFMSSMTELTLSSMLAAAGTKTIGLTIFNLQQGGDYEKAAAMSTLIVFVVLVLYAVSNILTKKKIKKPQKSDVKIVGIKAIKLNKVN